MNRILFTVVMLLLIGFQPVQQLTMPFTELMIIKPTARKTLSFSVAFRTIQTYKISTTMTKSTN